MTNFRSVFCFLVMVLAAGVLVLCGAPVIYAQEDKVVDAAKTVKDKVVDTSKAAADKVADTTKAATDKVADTAKDVKEEIEEEKPSREERKTVRVLPQQARAIALARVPGKVVETDLEKVAGRLQYEVEIRNTEGKEFEVEIDALTGDVLKVTEKDDK